MCVVKAKMEKHSLRFQILYTFFGPGVSLVIYNFQQEWENVQIFKFPLSNVLKNLFSPISSEESFAIYCFAQKLQLWSLSRRTLLELPFANFKEVGISFHPYDYEHFHGSNEDLVVTRNDSNYYIQRKNQSKDLLLSMETTGIILCGDRHLYALGKKYINSKGKITHRTLFYRKENCLFSVKMFVCIINSFSNLVLVQNKTNKTFWLWQLPLSSQCKIVKIKKIPIHLLPGNISNLLIYRMEVFALMQDNSLFWWTLDHPTWRLLRNDVIDCCTDEKSLVIVNENFEVEIFI